MNGPWRPCRCGTPVVFVRMVTGRRMPCDAVLCEGLGPGPIEPWITALEESDASAGDRLVICDEEYVNGRMIALKPLTLYPNSWSVAIPQEVRESSSAWLVLRPHWASCLAADEVRREAAGD